MKTSALTLLMVLLAAFALQASPDLTANVRLDSLMKSYTATHDSVIQRMDVITAKVDSVHTQIKSDSEKSWLRWDIDQANVWFAFVALCVGIIGTIFGILGYKASKRTADNVRRMTPYIQIAQFNDLIRHLYRDLVVTLAFSQKILESLGEKDLYPSEEHLLKLSVLPEEVQLENYNDNAFIYQKMHKLKILFRNYDAEIHTAIDYLKTSTKEGGETNIKRNTLSALIYRPLYLIEQILEISNDMKRQKERYWRFDVFRNAASVTTRVHIDKLIKWKDNNTSGFDWSTYKDLKKEVEYSKVVQQPYDGLSRAQTLFYKIATTDPVLLSSDEIFESEEQLSAFKKLTDGICGQDERLYTFNTKMLSGNYDFKQHFLTMLSIDVTIELDNIHMIKIN